MFSYAAPSSSPVNPTGSAADSRTLILTWNPPPFEDQNGIIREYKILVVELETMFTFTVVSYSLTATIGSLHPNYNYQCSITAVTISDGPYTQVFTITTPEDSKFAQFFLNVVHPSALVSLCDCFHCSSCNGPFKFFSGSRITVRCHIDLGSSARSRTEWRHYWLRH